MDPRAGGAPIAPPAKRCVRAVVRPQAARGASSVAGRRPGSRATSPGLGRRLAPGMRHRRSAPVPTRRRGRFPSPAHRRLAIANSRCHRRGVRKRRNPGPVTTPRRLRRLTTRTPGSPGPQMGRRPRQRPPRWPIRSRPQTRARKVSSSPGRARERETGRGLKAQGVRNRPGLEAATLLRLVAGGGARRSHPGISAGASWCRWCCWR
jgi:hypothetical protein